MTQAIYGPYPDWFEIQEGQIPPELIDEQWSVYGQGRFVGYYWMLPSDEPERKGPDIVEIYVKSFSNRFYYIGPGGESEMELTPGKIFQEVIKTELPEGYSYG